MTTTSRPHLPAVVHVEGMDLAGKSTLTAALARRHPGAARRRNALTVGNPVYALADEMRIAGSAPQGVLGHLYVAALRLDLQDPDALLAVGVQDSTILLRSLAYHSISGDEAIVAELAALIPRHPTFGRSVVLTADIETRRARLAQRARHAPEEVAPDDLMVLDQPDRFLAMEGVLVAVAVEHFGAAVIDTTGLAPDEVLAAVDDGGHTRSLPC